ncbi:MAG: hypothetical protein H7844_11370 [Nitrospirae bacterium YQR-1]
MPNSTYGNRPGFLIFHLLLKIGGLGAAYVLLLIILPYYILLRPSVFKISDHYLRRRFPQRGFIARYLTCFKYIYTYGAVLIEQVALGIVGTEGIGVEFPQREQFAGLVKKNRGLILLTTHIGPWQNIMATYDKMHCNVHFHFDTENWQGGHFFDLNNKKKNFSVISPRNFMGGMIEATNVLLKGQCLCVMGDRISTTDTVVTPFLGDDAHFPAYPYRLATATNSDIVVLLTSRIGPMKYYIEYKCLTDELKTSDMPRADAEKYLVRSYAGFIEDFLTKHPYMWYNFSNFWGSPLKDGDSLRE